MHPGITTAVTLLALIATPVVATAQRCALPIPGDRAPTDYRPRSDDPRCEGMYVGLQAEPLKIQPVSFVRGGLRFPAATTNARNVIATLVALSRDLAARDLQLVGRGAESNLHWALDAELGARDRFNWNLSEVVLPVGLTPQRIGVYAVSRAGNSEPLLVPLDVIGDNTPAAPRRELELVIRIPGASAARWQLDGGSQQQAEVVNTDGFFRIWIPTGESGIKRVAITWRTRGENRFTTVPELLRIYVPPS